MIPSNKAYNKFFDGLTELFWLSLWFIGIVVCWIILLAIGVAIIHDLLDLGRPNFINTMLLPAISLSLPMTFLVYYIKKAQRLYEIKQYRDCWLCFATILGRRDLPGGDPCDRDFVKWCLENAVSLYHYNDRKFFFLLERDAVMYQLSRNCDLHDDS